jgi:proteic killer suppression protein
MSQMAQRLLMLMRWKDFALDTASSIDDMDYQVLDCIPLKGTLEDVWAIDVNKHWRITFEFTGGDVYIST